jgi:hypothetical protein
MDIIPSNQIFLYIYSNTVHINHPPPSNAETKNMWNDTSTPPYIRTARCLLKHEGDIYLYFMKQSLS